VTITTRDGIINGLGNGATSLVINKAAIASQLAGGFSSLWRATGTPGQGAVPGAYAVCTSALNGAFTFANPTAPARTYLARLFMLSANSGTDIQVHDRLAHMGGLNGTLTSAQTTNVDVDVATSNMVARRGNSNFSDVQWWLEWYTATGATGVNATCAVTYDDGSTGNVVVALSGSVAASRMLPILPAVAGRFIKSIQSVTLSATTGTAGSFGVTATRALGGLSLGLANAGTVGDWAYLGFPRVHDDACLFMIMVPGTTSTGALYGSGKLIQG
jgi:hypothetical protein